MTAQVAAEACLDLLTFGSDVSTRRHWFSEGAMAHPAKLHLGLLQWIIDRYTVPGDTLCDPMAGSGSLLLAAAQQRNVILRDVEPRFLALMHENAAHILRSCGLFAGSIDIADSDAREPWGCHTDAIIMSPPYGCESGPTTWRRQGILPHRLRLLQDIPHNKRWDRLTVQQPGAQGGLQFHYGTAPAQVGAFRGPRYWEAMTAVYTQARTALRCGGVMVLVIKDHVSHGRRVCVADETARVCSHLGFALVERHQRAVSHLSLWQRRRKEHGDLVVEEEDVLCFR